MNVYKEELEKAGWEIRFSKTHDNRPYYYHTKTGKTQWEMPSFDLDDSVISCHHILIKHTGSRRPSSWRNNKIDLNLEDAISEAKGTHLII